MQGVDGLPEEVKAFYRTAWELPQRSLIDLAAARGPYIDQSQSLNLFLADPTIGKLSSMYLLRLAVRAEDDLLPAVATGDADPTGDHHRRRTGTRLSNRWTPSPAPENPESCEACQ